MVCFLSWHESQAKPVISWPVLQFLFLFTPAYLIGRANCMFKVLWQVNVLVSSLKVFSCYKKWSFHVPYLSLLRVLTWFLKDTPFLILVLSPHIFFLQPLPTWSLLLSYLPTPWTSSLYSFFISLFQKDSVMPVGHFLLISFFGSMDFSMSILYFMANIHLKVSTYHVCLSRSGLPHSGWSFLGPYVFLLILWCHCFY